MSNQSILRIGPIGASNGCSATLLRDALLRHFRPDGGGGGGGGDAGGGDGDVGNNGNMLAISNRYFDAGVLLLGLHQSHLDDEGGGGAVPPEEDGVLLVFDDVPIRDVDGEGGAPIPFVSFDSLDRIHGDAVAGNPPMGDLLRLCIGATAIAPPADDPPTVVEDEYSRRVLWCLDRGYEYVSVDMSEVGTTAGFDRRDKDGYARVIEAVETCMWSCRVMREGGGGGQGARGGGVERRR